MTKSNLVAYADLLMSSVPPNAWEQVESQECRLARLAQDYVVASCVLIDEGENATESQYVNFRNSLRALQRELRRER